MSGFYETILMLDIILTSCRVGMCTHRYLLTLLSHIKVSKTPDLAQLYLHLTPYRHLIEHLCAHIYTK